MKNNCLSRSFAAMYGAGLMLLALSLAGWSIDPVLATNCPDANYTLISQADVEEFPTGCDAVTGDLVIGPNKDIGPSADITDLSRLSSLTTVGGHLHIRYNSILMDVDGLSTISSTDRLTVAYNTALKDLDGLSALTVITSHGFIGFNPALANINGLSSLSSVGGALNIWTNASLTNLDGLSSLEFVGYLLFIRWTYLTNLDGLSSLTSVNGNVYIMENSALTSANLSALTYIGGDLTVSNNPQLEEVAIASLASVGNHLQMFENAKLEILEFASLTSVGGNLHTWDTQLTSLSGLSSLATVGRSFIIARDSVVTNLDGLYALSYVGEDLWIWENPELERCNCGLYRLFERGVISGTAYLEGNDSDGDCNNDGEDIVAPHICDLPPAEQVGFIRQIVMDLVANGIITEAEADFMSGQLDKVLAKLTDGIPANDGSVKGYVTPIDKKLDGIVRDRRRDVSERDVATLRAALDALVEGVESSSRTEAGTMEVAWQRDLPTGFSLDPAYPNPFNPVTTIRFGLPEAADVRLVVFDVLGRQVVTHTLGDRAAGWHDVQIDAAGMPSGIYLYRFTAGSFVATDTMVLLR